MAKLAAEEAVALRTKFKTPLDIHRHFASRITENASRIYCAAITAGLVGDFDLARQLFTRMAAMDPAKWGLWLPKYQEECAVQSALLDNPAGYRSAVLETITMQRQKRGFSQDPGSLQSLDFA
jgi:hypothetical protein